MEQLNQAKTGLGLSIAGKTFPMVGWVDGEKLEIKVQLSSGLG